jgi:hypothetical protein
MQVEFHWLERGKKNYGFEINALAAKLELYGKSDVQRFAV